MILLRQLLFTQFVQDRHFLCENFSNVKSFDLYRPLETYLTIFATRHVPQPGIYIYYTFFAALEAKCYPRPSSSTSTARTGAKFRRLPLDYRNLFPRRRPRSRARRLRPWPRRAGRALRERRVQPAPRPARCVRDGGSGARLS